MEARVIRVREEAYDRLLSVSQSYGLTMPQAANLLILGRVGPPSHGKRGGKEFPRGGKVGLEIHRFRCLKCGGELELMSSGPGLYMLKCPKCREEA
ncbi:MAG TPA: hypothetical protein G4O12_08350 [Dehalococcoidia bacterium]|nr:hypothetical protein [Dehalococcoidia bacterium]